MVIGPVAGLDLAWFESRPLFGRRVVVTRARAQASSLVTRLADLGATPIEVPTIQTEPVSSSALDSAVARLSEYSWVVFTSANAVTALLDRVPDSRALASLRVAAVGPGTAAALAPYRLVADLTPDSELAAALVPAFPSPPAGKVLFPRSASGRDELVDGLRGLGWEVDVVPAYRTVTVPVPEALRKEAASADAVCFTSSSTVTGFLSSVGTSAVPPVVVCIGPVTAETAVSSGLAVTAVASSHTIEGLVSTLVEVLAPTVGSDRAETPGGGRQ
jgi:uroporphyrinogen-III synthase